MSAWILATIALFGSWIDTSGRKRDDAAYFPLVPGTRWVYDTGTGGTLEASVSLPENGAANRRDLVWTGFQQLPGWPGRLEEHLELSKEGIRSTGHSYLRRGGGGSTGFGGQSLYCLRFPLTSGRRWERPMMIFGTNRSASSSAAHECRGCGPLLVSGKEVDCIRITWQFGNSDGEISASGSYWYAKGMGLVRGEMTVREDGRQSSLTWALKEIRIPK